MKSTENRGRWERMRIRIRMLKDNFNVYGFAPVNGIN